MIVLKNSVFYDFPKTGGSWISEGLVNLNIGEFKPGTSHRPPGDEYADKLKFTFIRHPVSWFRSYYASRVDKNLHFNMGLNEFVRYMYDESPKIFDNTKWTTLTAFMGAFINGCSFIGKTENLKTDLYKVLKMAGEGFDIGGLLDRPKVNVSTAQVSMDEDTRKLIEEKESYIIERFYGKD